MENLFGPPVILPGKASQKIRRPRPDVPFQEYVKPISSGCDYAKKYIKEEEELYESKQDKINVSPQHDAHGCLSEVDSVTVTDLTSVAHSIDDKCSNVYEKYSFYKRESEVEDLPIFESKDYILNGIEASKVVIIKGATGCGKTTQVPQFILDSASENNIYCKIVVTQPRRIAAVSVAKRVCEERKCPVGSLIGYQIGQDRKADDDTRLLYCTTGVLLQKLITQKTMKEFTHIVLDEIHERDQEMDFLLLVVRKLLNTNSKNVKVILMSATIDTAIFTEYFFTMSNKIKIYPVVHEVPEKRNHNVMEFFLGDIKSRIAEANDIILSVDSPDIDKKGYMTAVRLIQAFDSVDERENQNPKQPSPICIKGSVLVFLPGLHEIEEMVAILESKTKENINKEIKEYKWEILPLHSSITHDEQRAVFRKPRSGYRKIILSTNIAESSITVTDIKYVIDFCLTKTLMMDPNTNLSSLQLKWASRNSLMQRAGRVGRVSDGRVYRLITEQFYHEELEQETMPEILRCPLDRLVLQAKLLDMGEPRAVFGIALSQPDQRNIGQTVSLLKEIGALLVTANDVVNPYDGDLTFLGQVIAKLPIDVRLGKLIYLGNLFGVLEQSIIMACAMSAKNIFSSPFKDYLKAYNSKLSWADSTCSDCIAFYNAYMVWRKRHAEGLFRTSSEIKWGKERFIEIKTLREIAVLHKDISARLKQSGISDKQKKKPLEKEEEGLLLKLAIAGAFYPNYFLRGAQGGQVDEKDAIVTLQGYDPYSTVYLQGMQTNQPAVLYRNSIRSKFEHISNRVNVYFDNGTKVFINFGRSEVEKIEGFRVGIPGKVDLAVYRAVKMRQLENKVTIPALNTEEANKRYSEYLHKSEKYLSVPDNVYDVIIKDIPWPWRREAPIISELKDLIEIHISFIYSPEHFWIQCPSVNVLKLLHDINKQLNMSVNREPLDGNLKVGQMCAAVYYENGERNFYRCRILSRNIERKTYTIYFIDYGNTERNVPSFEIFNFSRSLREEYKVDKIPNLAVECSLAKVKPAHSSTQYDEEWSQKAIETMKRYYLKKTVCAKVYSIVNDIVIVMLELPDTLKNTFGEKKTFNQVLIEKGEAIKCEEGFLSMMNHVETKKMKKMMADGTVMVPADKKTKEPILSIFEDFDSPSLDECSHQIFLRGPFSPLEMKIYSVTQCSISKNVKIDAGSVNSVLLDTSPTDSHERMLVSAFVGTNPSGEKLNLRHTTVMPGIPGLPALVCLMFAPTIELRSNPTNTKLSGALCGIGYDKLTRESLFPDNDIELVFDVEFTLSDIEQINKFRFWLNKAVCASSGGRDTNELVECGVKMQDHILNKIFVKKYEFQELYYNVNSYQWGLIPEQNEINPCIDRSVGIRHPSIDFTYAYRFIWGIRLDGDSSIDKAAVLKNRHLLKEFAHGKATSMKSVECVLCRVTLSNCFSAKLHIKSGTHRIRANRFYDKDDEEFKTRSETEYR